MDAAKALENIKEALDSGMGPLPTLAMIRETVAEMYPSASPATAPPSDLQMLAVSKSQGKSAAPYLKLKDGETVKFVDPDTVIGHNAAFYKKYMEHKPSKFEGYKPVGAVYDEMPMADWEKALLGPKKDTKEPDWETANYKAEPDLEVPEPNKPIIVKVFANGATKPHIPVQQRTPKLTAQLQEARLLAVQHGSPVTVQVFLPTEAELKALAQTETMTKMKAHMSDLSKLSDLFKGLQITAQIKPEDAAVLKKHLLGEKPPSPND